MIDLLALLEKNATVAATDSTAALDKSLGITGVAAPEKPAASNETGDGAGDAVGNPVTSAQGLSPSQAARGFGNLGLAALGAITGNPLAAGKAVYDLTKLDERGYLGKLFDSMFGYNMQDKPSAISWDDWNNMQIGVATPETVAALFGEDNTSTENNVGTSDWGGVDWSSLDSSGSSDDGDSDTSGPTSDYGGATGSDY